MRTIEFPLTATPKQEQIQGNYENNGRSSADALMTEPEICETKFNCIFKRRRVLSKVISVILSPFRAKTMSWLRARLKVSLNSLFLSSLQLSLHFRIDF